MNSDLVFEPDDESGEKLMTIATKEVRGEIKMVPTPWPLLNSLMAGGFAPGECTLVAGRIGAGKTYMALSIMLHAIAKGFDARMMPLEDNAVKAMRRCLAIECCDWKLIEHNPESAELLQAALLRKSVWVKKIQPYIYKNPRAAVESVEGRPIIPPLPYTSVLDWAADCIREGAKVLIVDPISKIDYCQGRQKPWEGQKEFIENIVGMVEPTDCHLILVCHMKKDTGVGRGLSENDIEGASGLSKFSHNVLLFDKHAEKAITVSESMGDKTYDLKQHIFISKTRDAPGTGLKIGVRFCSTGPVLDFLGVIKPKAK